MGFCFKFLLGWIIGQESSVCQISLITECLEDKTFNEQTKNISMIKIIAIKCCLVI